MGQSPEHVTCALRQHEGLRLLSASPASIARECFAELNLDGALFFFFFLQGVVRGRIKPAIANF